MRPQAPGLGTLCRNHSDVSAQGGRMFAPRERAGTRAVERRAVHGTDRRRPTGWGPGGIVSVAMAVAMATIVGTTACASRPTVVAVPTFPPGAPTSTVAETPPDDGHRLPSDCEELVGQDEISALFGLPLGSVTVRTVRGTPSPSVGRLERMTCTYTVYEPATPPRRGVVLRIAVGAYRDVVAAHDQHERNVADERAGASSSLQPEIGTAAATLVQRDAKCVLLTSSDTVTLDLDLTPRPVPLPPVDLLTDIARRVLARLPPNPPRHSPGHVSP